MTIHDLSVFRTSDEFLWRVFVLLSSPRGRNDRADVDCSIKVMSAVRRAVVSVSRDRDMTRNTRQSDPHAVPAWKSRCAKTIEDNGESDFTYKGRRSSRVCARHMPTEWSLLTPRLLHGHAYRECIHKLRNYGNSYDVASPRRLPSQRTYALITYRKWIDEII